MSGAPRRHRVSICRIVLRVETMAAHKYHVGQIVHYRPESRVTDVSPGVYEITRRLPERDGQPLEYRIRSLHEPHERVAKESESQYITERYELRGACSVHLAS